MSNCITLRKNRKELKHLKLPHSAFQYKQYEYSNKHVISKVRYIIVLSFKLSKKNNVKTNIFM